MGMVEGVGDGQLGMLEVCWRCVCVLEVCVCWRCGMGCLWGYKKEVCFFPCSVSSQAFWLRSSVVSVLISVKTDIDSIGINVFILIFPFRESDRAMLTAHPRVSLELQFLQVTPSLLTQTPFIMKFNCQKAPVRIQCLRWTRV